MPANHMRVITETIVSPVAHQLPEAPELDTIEP